MSDYLSQLNDLQQRAVLCTDGPLLIVAGAGTGKTKTITYRIYHLIKSGVPAESILGITFTNKAAKEMRERVQHLLGVSESGNPWTSHGLPMLRTFHSLGVYILRTFHEAAGLPKHFTIMDTDDTTSLIKEAMKQLSIDPKENDPRTIRTIISSQKGSGFSYEDFAPKVHSAQTELAANIWRIYEQLKKTDKAVDFDDLLLMSLELVRKNATVRQALQDRFQYIHIDEYQDTNKVQYELVRILADKHKNLCVVGDTDQNIYSWRGANIRNMLNFEKDYPDATLLTLEENYRSTKVILEAADAIISKNTARFEKNLRTENTRGDKISCLVALNGMDEAYHIAKHAERIIAAGVSPSEIAVLYRTNFQSRAIEESFLRSRLPYQVIGTKFFERKEIKDAIAYLRAALDPSGLAAVKRIINEPKRGLGPAAVATIFAGQADTLSAKQKQSYASFQQILETIAACARNKPISETIRTIIRQSGMEEILKQGTEEDRERLMNLEELVTFATRYDTEEKTVEEILEQFLEDTALRSDQDEMEDGEKKPGVRLMTIHASKGLEFAYVFVSGLEQGLFPSDRSSMKQSVDDREEERRLFYVAITRAKQKLFLSYAHIRTIYGRESFQAPSEFLGDIPADIVEHDEAKDRGENGSIKTVYLDF